MSPQDTKESKTAPAADEGNAGDIAGLAGLTSATAMQCSESTLTGPTIIIRPQAFIIPRKNLEEDVDHDHYATKPSLPLIPASVEGGSLSPYINSARGSKSPDGPNQASPEGPIPATPFDSNVPNSYSNNVMPICDLVSNEDPSTPVPLVEDQPCSKGNRVPYYRMRIGGRRPKRPVNDSELL